MKNLLFDKFFSLQIFREIKFLLFHGKNVIFVNFDIGFSLVLKIFQEFQIDSCTVEISWSMSGPFLHGIGSIDRQHLDFDPRCCWTVVCSIDFQQRSRTTANHCAVVERFVEQLEDELANYCTLQTSAYLCLQHFRKPSFECSYCSRFFDFFFFAGTFCIKNTLKFEMI